MWVMTLFDLPVVSKCERKRATGFRNYLLNEGFEMSQFSVYVRFVRSYDQARALTRRIGREVPPDGKVDVVFFTDKQYEAIVSFRGVTDDPRPKKPTQLALF
jgi:CRISPR-associated protein Cas2